MANIGFIGLGNMGAPMAANLAAAGHTVTGFDVTNVAVEGVTLADSAVAATEGQDVVVTCLLYTSPSPRDLSTSRMPSSA